MNSDLGHSAASASEASTTPLSREHADAIQRMPYVRACLLEYANRPEDSTAIEAVKAIAAQVQSLAASTPALPNGWSIKDAAYVAECLDGKWGDGMQVGSTDAGARFIRAVLATPSRSSADTARPGSDEQDAPASPAQPQGEREAFEAWADSEGYPTKREHYDKNVYADPRTHAAWWAWKEARASLSASTPSAAVPVALTDDDWQTIADELDTIIFSRVRQAIDKRLAEKQQCK